LDLLARSFCFSLGFVAGLLADGIRIGPGLCQRLLVSGNSRIRLFLQLCSLIEIGGNAAGAGFEYPLHARDDHPLHEKVKQAEGDRQPQELRREGCRIEGRKPAFVRGVMRHFGARMNIGTGAFGFRRRLLPIGRCHEHESFLSAVGPAGSGGPFFSLDQANSARSAMSSEKMPMASVTAKPKIRRPNWPSAAEGLRSAPAR